MEVVSIQVRDFGCCWLVKNLLEVRSAVFPEKSVYAGEVKIGVEDLRR